MLRVHRSHRLRAPPVLGDLTRSRILLLARAATELTVAELCAVMQIPQSTVSRHLKALADGGWVTRARRGHEPALPRSCATAMDPVGAAPLATRARADRRHGERGAGWTAARARARERRSSRSSSSRPRRASGTSSARELFGATRFIPRLCSGCSTPSWTVGDLGCGTGAVAETRGAVGRPGDRRRRVGGDAASGETTRPRRSPTSRCGAAASKRLPIADASLDAATCVLVLASPPGTRARARRGGAGAPSGGRLLLTAT